MYNTDLGYLVVFFSSRPPSRNLQTQDNISSNANSPCVSSPSVVSSHQVITSEFSPYSTTQAITSLQSTHKDCFVESSTTSTQQFYPYPPSSRSAIEVSQNKYPETSSVDSGVVKGMPACSAESPELNPNSPTSDGYWSENSSQSARFQNPLDVLSRMRAENSDRYIAHPMASGNVTGTVYPQSPRVLTEYAVTQQAQLSSSTKMWQTPRRSSESTQNEFPQPNFQMSPGYYPPSPITHERSFKRTTGNISHTDPVNENYPLSPQTTHVMSPHVTATPRHHIPPSPAIFPRIPPSPAYPQSPPAIPSYSQSHESDGYSQPLLSPASPPQMMTQAFPAQYPQAPPEFDRYSQSSTYATVSPQSSYSSPPTVERYNPSPPRYPLSSQSLPPVYHQQPARSSSIPSTTTELYPQVPPYVPASISRRANLSPAYSMPSSSNPGYHQSSNEYPIRSTISPTPHSMHQDTIIQPKSPENIHGSPSIIPPPRVNVRSIQSRPRSTPAVVGNLTHYPVQSEVQDSLYQQAHLKKSAEVSLSPCKINTGGTHRPPCTISRSETLPARNDRSQLGKNQLRRLDILSPANEVVPQHDLMRRPQSVNCERQAQEMQDITSEHQTYQQRTQGASLLHIMFDIAV